MANVKTKKRAIMASGLSLVLCVAMLVGSTFAWFTDSVTSRGNIIQSGTFDVAMEWADGTESLDNAAWKDASEGAIFEYTNWEPGYAVARHIRVKNNGTLALKYRLEIAAEGEVSKLAEAIDVYAFANGQQLANRTELAAENRVGTLAEVLAGNAAVPYENHISAGKLQMVTVALKMQEDAGNEYQGLAIGSAFSVKLLATQYTEENDGFGNNQYDANAGFTFTASSEDELNNVLAKAEAGDTVVVGSTFTGNIVLPENLQGVTLVSDGAQANQIMLNANGIDNIVFDGFAFDRTQDNLVSIKLENNKNIGHVTFKNCTITGKGQKVTDGLSGKNQNTELTFEDCTFKDVGRPIYDEFGGYKSLTVKNCTFDNSNSTSMSWVATLQGHLDTIVIDGCRFIGRTEGMLKMSGGCDSFTFTNNVLVNCEEHPGRGMFEGSPKKVVWSGNTFDGESYASPFGN